MFGDRVVMSDGKFYPISKEVNQRKKRKKKKKKFLGFLIFSCGTRQVQPKKDGSEVSRASYQPDAKAKFEISLQEDSFQNGVCWTLEGQDGWTH